MGDANRRPAHSRRGFLGGVVGAVVGGTVPASAEPTGQSGAAPTVSVMTRNCYLGVDLFRLFEAESNDDVRRIAGRMLADVRRHPYDRRAEAIAAEVDEHRPDVVGLQEAALVRVQRPGDFGDDATPNASDVVDILDLLSAALAARGLEYEVAASVVTNDVEVPADVDGGHADVRLTDRVVLLVQGDVDVDDVATATFEEAFTVPVPDGEVSLERGYCLADVTVDGVAVTVATVHLESVVSSVRRRQAEAMLDALPADRPVVLAGDFNDGPVTSGGAYERLIRSFEDAHTTLDPDADGFTCCQDADLRNDRSGLSRRIDAVLHRGIPALAVERVGEGPDDRIRASVGGESVRLWPSDHAGVVATFGEPGATPTRETAPPSTATRTGTPTTTAERSTTLVTETPADGTPATSTADGSTDAPLPGFGPVVAVLAVLYATLTRARRVR